MRVEQASVGHVEVTVGDGLGLVSASTLAIVDTRNGDLAGRLWAHVRDGAGVDDLLEELSATGLRSLGSFVMADLEDGGVRLVVRGEAVATVVGDGVATRIDAGAVRTWVEQVIDGPVTVSLSLRGDDVRESTYRANHGLLPTAALHWPARDLAAEAVRDADVAEYSGFEAPIRPADGAASDVRVTSAPPVEVHRPVETDAEPGSAEDGVQANPVENEQLPGETIHIDRFREVDDDDGFDHLYGDTVQRTVHDAAVHSSDDAEAGSPELISRIPEQDEEPAKAPLEAGDHDGLTISIEELRQLREEASGPPLGGPTVSALVCTDGHANPPILTACRVCQMPLGSSPTEVARPTLGQLRFSTGEIIPVSQPLIVGRNPAVDERVAGELPELVRLDGGSAVSRSHFKVHIEDWQVLVEDLGSANGTIITLPGREPLRLRPGEQTLVRPGTVIDVGGEIEVVYDDE